MIHPIDLKYYALTLLEEERKKKAAALGAVAQAQAPSYQWVYPALFFGAVAAMMYFSSKDSEHSNPVTPLPKDEADPEELSKGSLVELEHTDDEDEAERIALQHLAEDPHYYSKLETVFPEHQNPYTVTDRMNRNARDSYALGIIKIDPLDFLKLTAENPDRIFEENKERNLKYQDYEDFGLKDEILVHPFLTIRPDYSDGWSVGWITGHEGRHRAAAAYMEGEDFYCYIIPSPLDKTQKLKDAVMSGEGLKFIPKVLKNQFRDLGEIVEVRVKKSAIRQNPNFPEIRELISKMKQKEIKAEIKELLSGGGTFGDLTSNQKTYFVLLFNELQRRRREKKLRQNPIPPAAVAREAREGLELRASVAPSKRGGTSVGLARAKQLSSRQNISENTMKRMRSFFARHEVDKKAKGFRRGEVGYPSKGLQAWKLWGGDAGKRWVKKS